MENQTFKEAFAVLQHHAQALQDQPEPDIDSLLAIVAESVDAYKVCRERIEAVERVLETSWSDTTLAHPASLYGAAIVPPNNFAPFEPEIKEIPFFRLLVQPEFSTAINRFN